MDGPSTTFAEARAAEPGLRFSEWLRRGAEPHWSAAVGHRFTDALAANRLEEEVFRRYLVQDFAFIETLVTVVALAVADAPSMAEKKVLAGFLSVLTGGENDYFERAFAALSVPPRARSPVPLAPATRGFAEVMLEAARSGSYARALAVLAAAEWTYLAWATRVGGQNPGRFYYREWIELHTAPAFAALVGWLKAELDHIGPALAPAEQGHLWAFFRRMLELEAAFFEAAYAEG
ncbi:MAG: TenA family protein [Proteobacteria bacterium]|nr:TenA family protein [Pseudomonadota bacterium]